MAAAAEELFARIRLDDGAAFDEDEAARAISILETSEVGEVERRGNDFVVRLDLFHGLVPTVHTLRMPLAKDEREFGRRSARALDMRRAQEVRINLEPSGELYDKLVVATEGYVGTAPIIHKDAVVVEVLAQLRAIERERPPEF